MAAEETKRKEDTTASRDFTSTPMGQMMSEMMKRCCAGGGGSSACASMMKEMMEGVKHPSSRSEQASEATSGEKKK